MSIQKLKTHHRLDKTWKMKNVSAGAVATAFFQNVRSAGREFYYLSHTKRMFSKSGNAASATTSFKKGSSVCRQEIRCFYF
jgi:hypothetical protein